MGRPHGVILVGAALIGLTIGGCSSATEPELTGPTASTQPLPGAGSVPADGETKSSEPPATESPTTEPAAPEETAVQEGTSEEASADEEEPPEVSSDDDGNTSEAEPNRAEENDAPQGDVIVVSDWAAFTTPAQAAYCIISGPSNGMPASISCEVAQSSVPANESLMGICDSEGIGWFFNFDAANGHGGFFCNHVDGITRGGGNPHYWQDDPWINHNNVVTLPSGARVAALDYGRVMRAGDMDCIVQPDGLTCAAEGSGRGFTVNSGSYRSW